MRTLFSKNITTPLGNMIALANENALLLLDFEDSKYYEKHLKEVSSYYTETNKNSNRILDLTEKELRLYFKGKLKEFTVPVEFIGTDFQKKVWQSLQKIGFGEIRSYQSQADWIKNPKAVRAVANANSRNKICVVIPCHRVLGKNLSLTGYAGGVDRKEKLLKLEGSEFNF